MMTKNSLLSFFILWGCSFLFLLSADPQRGKELYLKHCASCHGENGDGKGLASYLLSPRPRDFTSGTYKFRSRPSGSPPTDQDLLRTLKRGVPGTAMPAWDRFPESDLLALVQHLKSLSDTFEDEDIDPPITIAEEPANNTESILEGKKVYALMKCADCHGVGGQGDGPSAKSLKDDQGLPLLPYNFTKGIHLMKSGSNPEDIYRTFMTGLDGTPMPSYGFLMDMEGNKGWHLVHYIMSLSAKSSLPPIVETPILRVHNVSVNPSLSTTDPVWMNVPSSLIPLRPLWKRDSFSDRIKIQTVLSEQFITFRLEWEDSTQDEEVVDVVQFRDGVALQLVPNANPKDHIGLPFLGMGDPQTTVSIWHWKADWEKDLAGIYHDSTTKYGDTMNRIQASADFQKERAYHAGWEAENLMSTRHRKSSVESLVAKGFGTLTSLPQEQQVIQGKGVWENGVWTVVFQAPRALVDSNPYRAFPLAVALWDGSAGDRNGQKSISQWMELQIK